MFRDSFRTHVPEGRRLFENLTVNENLRLATFARTDTDGIHADRERVVGGGEGVVGLAIVMRILPEK